MPIGTPQQIATFDGSTSGGSDDCAMTVAAGGAPLGSVLFLAIADIDGGAVIDSITDTRGNTYTVRVEQGHGSVSVRGWIATAVVTTALQAGDTITVSFDQFDFVGILVYYVTGLDTAGYIGASSAEMNFATAFSSGSIVVPGDGIVFGDNTNAENTYTYTPTNSFLELDDIQLVTVGNPLQTQYRIVTAGSYASTATLSSNDDGCALAVAWSAESAPSTDTGLAWIRA